MVRIEKTESSGSTLPSKCGSTQNISDANIKVVVRVRPLNKKELQQNNRVVVDIVDDRLLVFDPKEDLQPFFYQGVQQPSKNIHKRANKELKFVFDHVCGQNALNNDVFETTTKSMLSALMEGYNCSVFVYGATGAGKTFTMIGDKDHPGITYLTMDHLFYIINSFKNEREFDIGVSYIEVYNENVYDLLKPSHKPLQLREDSKYGVMVAGLTLNSINTARELLNMLENGNKNRTQHPTDANAESSRSHAVFQVYVKMRYKTSSQLRIVKLSMIDLAGSERASATGCIGDRFKEGANINRSLLALGNCINKLADGSSYIPYRDSKLTRLLKDSLGGNCKTVMIANVSPSSMCYEDTYNTLKYAARANKIQLSIKKNIVDGDMRLSQYVKINEELKKKVKELEAKLTFMKPTQSLMDSKETAEWKRRVMDVECVRDKLETELLQLMSRQRVLSLRHRLRTRAIAQAAYLAHRSSCEAMDMVCTEEIPRKERAAENYVKESVRLDSKVSTVWTKWDKINKEMHNLCDQAVQACPGLKDFIDNIHLKSELRLIKAKDELRYKLLVIENEEIEVFTEYMSEMPNMLKKLFLTLKGYDKATPALTTEYMEIMKKAKSARGISWSDKQCETDTHFKFVSTLDLKKPSVTLDYAVKDDNLPIEVVTDSEDLTDVDNKEHTLTNKRKGTPIKLFNNETIVINDSFDCLDVTRNINSAKKVKREWNIMNDVENYDVIDPKELNSTFVMAENIEVMKKQPIKCEGQTDLNMQVKSGLVDRTNTMSRPICFNDKAKIVKPLVGKAMPFKRATPGVGGGPLRTAAGFGSSLSRDGTPFHKNFQESTMASRNKTNQTQKLVGFKAVRARERMQTHPYTRPAYARK